MTELPTTFGKYYLTEKLATGGMAEIYLAKIIGPGGFEKSLVIKQIHPKLSGQRHFVDLFVAEAKTLVTLAHGNIVPVYELGVIDDTYFIAMDYIDGPTLYRLTETMSRRDVEMEPAIAAWITARILDGLDYAHRKGDGVIHRDLSPRNVMLSRDGEVKLVDFGIAVTLGEPGESEATQSAPTGSFPYMSPEQVRREALNPQTDLFSVGVLLWEMLAGRRLFARPAAEATLEAVLREAIPSPSSVRDGVPARLEEVVMRALQRDRQERWSSAGEMLASINKYLYSLDQTPGPRDLAALVARYCPPETRRLPTNLEGLLNTEADHRRGDDNAARGDKAAGDNAAGDNAAGDNAAGDNAAGDNAAGDKAGGDEAADDKGRDEAPVASGPKTAVIPRGKPQRQRSFATNVDLKVILDRATPLMSFDAINDVEAREDVGGTEAAERSNDAVGPSGAAPFGTDTIDKLRAKAADKLRKPPSQRMLVLVGFGALALAAGSIYMFYRGRERVLEIMQDAALEDPAIARHRTAPDATSNTLDDAGLPTDAAEQDAGTRAPADAAREVRDAGSRRTDATRPRPPVIDAGSVQSPAGTATLEIGADPWGEIYVDGKPRGRTPGRLVVPAGHHTVEIVFPAEQPPRKQTFAVDLVDGDVKPLQADFK